MFTTALILAGVTNDRSTRLAGLLANFERILSTGGKTGDSRESDDLERVCEFERTRARARLEKYLWVRGVKIKRRSLRWDRIGS